MGFVTRSRRDSLRANTVIRSFDIRVCFGFRASDFGFSAHSARFASPRGTALMIFAMMSSTFNAEAEGIKVDDIIAKIIKAVPRGEAKRAL